MRRVVFTFSAILCATHAIFSMPAAAQIIPLSSIEAKCPAPYIAKPVDGKCQPDPNADFTKMETVQKCEVAPGLKYENNRCGFVKGKEPQPSCGTAIPDLAFKDGACVVDRSMPRSAAGDYVGDYFLVTATSAAHPDVAYPQSSWIRAVSQQKLGDDDRSLTVVATDRPCFGLWLCGNPLPGEQTKTVKASDLIALGARRIGWTYGVLALPYKYYEGTRSFAGQISLGPYIGRRYGAPGSAVTIALAAAIGSVKGEVRDADNNVTSTPDLQAYSIAGGVMWDISKAPDIKPFKLGLFVGADTVAKDKVVKFPNDRKLWIAFQVGFDFTDK